jgi:hypothetical protein
LGDRRRAALSPAGGCFDEGRNDGVGVIALVGPERAVLDGDRRVQYQFWDFLVGDDVPALALEARQLDRARRS